MSNDQNLQPTRPPQHQSTQPGIESKMNPRPVFHDPNYVGSGKLKGKVAIITGGDSGIGRAVAVRFAQEGASVTISYLNEQTDAFETKEIVESYGARCLLIPGDIRDETVCQSIVQQTTKQLGGLDILINNAAEQHPQKGIEQISKDQLYRTFETNVFSFFYLTKAALPYLKRGSSIINTTSVTAYEGNEQLIDYSATKGAITTFTRSLSKSLVGKGIRVNNVAPGPIWTPLIPASFDEQKVATFGANTPMKRPGEPLELASAYVFLASEESSYMTGQTIHINGGVSVSS